MSKLSVSNSPKSVKPNTRTNYVEWSKRENRAAALAAHPAPANVTPDSGLSKMMSPERLAWLRAFQAQQAQASTEIPAPLTQADMWQLSLEATQRDATAIDAERAIRKSIASADGLDMTARVIQANDITPENG